ncbi:MAG: bifunctional 2-polyprenyl-6-hydroxyphenol methylase/3-demethylubiquinol 3-O-methyltransferase UbiG [Desulfobacteraceae bacterium]|nr:bifunctional 2-polyprenyl-6-hydroxyphenol methylase/3-demethylubiquinol 3-O-methyltransferase UbiG [Desulfobacteraceae bacterium]
MQNPSNNVDPNELAKFKAMADLWWQPKGEFKALHDINPVRLAYVRDRAGLAGKEVLDVGCGGGLLAEAMARAGARVTGIDMEASALAAARRHAAQSGLKVDYHQGSAEIWAAQHGAAYDTVTCMELVEHVPDPGGLIQDCARLLKPGGHLFLATVNRTLLSRVLVIWLAEYVFGIVRRGTHTFAKFVQPQELTRWGEQAGLRFMDLSGVRYVPFVGRAWLCRDVGMNYLMHFRLG